MSNNIDNETILLIGAGSMSIEYAKVLQALNKPFKVIGRGNQSAEWFSKETAIEVLTGGLEGNINKFSFIPSTAIVSVDIDQLASSTLALINSGVKRVLVEKPAGLNPKEIHSIANRAQSEGAEVFVAYNRRFYTSVIQAKKIICEDGGVSSFLFEFTEWQHVIEKLNKPSEILKEWFLGNSSHVIDLAFYLGGKPKEISSFTSGGLSWHPQASIFSGAGVSEKGALFSYHANWSSPGRWGVEILTKHHRLILRPLEKLQIQKIGEIEIEEIEIDDELDRQFKPGIYRQIQAFLQNNIGLTDSLLPIHEHSLYVNKFYRYMLNPNLKRSNA